MAEFFQVDEFMGFNEKGEREYREAFINPDYSIKIVYDRIEKISRVWLDNMTENTIYSMVVKGNLTEILIPVDATNE